MRKVKFIVSMLLLVCLCLAFLPGASAATYAALELDTAKSGSQYIVTVKLTGSKRPQMIEFCLEYDSSKLKLQSVAQGSVFSSANAPTYSTPKTGRVLFAWEALTGLKDGKLLVLTFTAKSGASGTADVFFNEDYNTVFMDGDMDDITVSLHRAEIDLDEEEWEEEEEEEEEDDETYEPYETADPYAPDSTAIPLASPTPAPWEEPAVTAEPGAEAQTVYTMSDMTIYAGQVCATQEGFLFLSSDTGVVVIENGQLKGVAPGIATVTAYQNGSAVGTCTITVQANPADSEIAADSGVSFLKIVLWAGIGLILASLIMIGVILIRRGRR